MSIGVRPVPADRTSASEHTGPAIELPGWPVLVLLWGMPVWWALGMLPFATAIMAVPMLAFLLQRGNLTIVPGVMPWIAFVVWIIPCALMLDSLSGMMGLSFRFGQFAAVAVAMVYVVNARRTLTVRRVLAGLSFTWVFVIIGGYLGMLWPDVALTFTIGRLLPDDILENEYVSDLVFPPFAEVQTPYGAEEPFLRPSAPFAYANGWGAGMAILTPIAVAAAIERRTARAIIFLFVGIVAAIPPAIATTNRGLFLGLIAAVGYVLIRLLLRGKWLPFLWVGALSVLLAVVLGLSGLLSDIAARQEISDTTAGREVLYIEAFQRTLQSPILGYGAPRASYSTEIAVGTQGMIWNAMFCFGFVGLALFILFFAGALIRTASAPNVSALWLHSAVIAAATMSIFYGLDRHMFAIALVVSLMLRERYSAQSNFWIPNPRSDG